MSESQQSGVGMNIHKATEGTLSRPIGTAHHFQLTCHHRALFVASGDDVMILHCLSQVSGDICGLAEINEFI